MTFRPHPLLLGPLPLPVTANPLAFTGRFRVGQNLLNRPEIQIVLLAGFTPAHPAGENVATDVRPGVHVGNHSFPSRF